MKIKLNFFSLFLLLTFIVNAQDNVVKKSVEFLNSHKLSPEQYIVSKFKTHDIILLSEDHGVKENWQLMHSIIPDLYKNGIYNIGMEFGAYEDQQKLDSLISAPEYNEQTARDIMFNYNSQWALIEYMEIYRKAWEFNKTLKPGMRKFRILNLSYKYNWTEYKAGVKTPENMKAVFSKGNTETYRFSIIEKEIIKKGEKILIITGDIHAFTKYKFPVYDYLEKDFVKFENRYFGELLYTKYPRKVYSILLHKPFSNYPNKLPYLITPGNGFIEQIMLSLGNIEIGFDLNNTPLGRISDSSFYSMGYKNFTLSDLYDGYIFLKPVNKLSSCTIDTLFINSKDLNEILNNTADPDWRKRPESVNEYWQQISEYSNIPKRYSYIK